MAERNLFIDIETIPPGSEEEFVIDKTPPKTIKDPEKIEKWYLENKRPLFLKQSLDTNKAHILTIGAAFDDEKVELFYDEGENVEAILRTFRDFIFDNIQEELEDGKILTYDVKFIGHNVRRFDLEIIWVNAMKFGLFDLAKLISRHPYSHNVFDTMEIWSGPNRQNYIKLDEILRILNLGSKMEGMDGSKVYEEYINGNLHSKILPYQAHDVEDVRKIFNFIKDGVRT